VIGINIESVLLLDMDGRRAGTEDLVERKPSLQILKTDDAMTSLENPFRWRVCNRKHNHCGEV